MEIYDVPQLARMLRVNRRTIRIYLKDGRLTGRKVAKRWLVCDDALRAFMFNGKGVEQDIPASNSVDRGR